LCLIFFHNVLAIVLANPVFESFCSLCPFLGYLFTPGENDLTRSKANTAFQASSPLPACQCGRQHYHKLKWRALPRLWIRLFQNKPWVPRNI